MQASATPTATATRTPRWRWITKPAVWAHGVFWSWNAIFLLLVTTGLVPTFGPEFWRDLRAGALPYGLALTLVAVVAIPLVAVGVGIALRRRPGDLVALFYGLELPLFFLASARLFLVRQVTWPQAALAACAVVGLIGFATTLLPPQWQARLPGHRVVGVIRVALLTSIMCFGAWLGTLLFLYIAPFAYEAIVALVTARWWQPLWDAVLRLPDALWRNPREFLLVILAFACAAFSATLLCALPFAAPYLYLRAWYRSCVALAQLRSRAWAAVVVGLSVMLIAAVFSLSLTQPQTEAFERLSTPPHSDGERRSLLAHADALRDGLQNAYLAAYRYQGTAGLPRAVSEQYRHAFGGSLEDWRVLGLWHDLLAAPWLYQGESIAGDARRAAELYTQFFDAQIQRDQREAVSAALNATYDRDGIEAGVLNIGSARVLLLSQNIEVTEHGDMADVEWSEVYQNQTLQPQEVLYYFSLPQSAVVTGLWLGESPDKASAAAFVVAPRGAAARVYRASVRRSIDPALLEQVGPRQYRLRVFPIPAKDYRTDEAKPLYLWLRYSVMATPDGWPAPRLLERRNVFWTEQSKRAHNGVLSTDEAPWSPAALPRNSATKPTVHTATLQGGLRVTATPTATPIAAAARGLRLLVVVDRSYSMRAVQGPLQTALQRLAQTGHDVDYCLSAAPSRGEPARMTRRVGEADLLFYGGHPQSTLLQQMGELALTHPYHAVIVLTDAGGYDLESKDVPPAAALYRRDAPLWLVHLGGGLPFAYADEVWAAVHRSGGGIATTLDEALLQIEPRLSGGLSSQAVARFADGYLWRVERSDVATTTPTDEAFVPLAARAALAAMQATAEADTPTAQDDMHALAKSYGIISPLSSMIVLVTDAQREALRQAQHAQDRFKRDTENGVEDLTAPSGSDVVSGVPEPQEWALLLAAAAMAAIYLYRNKNPLRRVL